MNIFTIELVINFSAKIGHFIVKLMATNFGYFNHLLQIIIDQSALRNILPILIIGIFNDKWVIILYNWPNSSSFISFKY